MSDPYLGDKIRAGRILSSMLRKIAQEPTELVEDPENGERLGTKAEALARQLWKIALGYKEEILYDLPEGGRGVKEVHHPPDRAIASLIFDRVEGKVATVAEHEKMKATAAEKVSKVNKDRLNRLSKGVVDGTTSDGQ